MTPIARRQVPETAAGFGYQFERALLRLAESKHPDSLVGVETEDDVALKDPGETNVLEQDKLSYAKSGHPFTDRGVALWNTLDNWMLATATGTQYHREAELHLVTNRPVPDDCLAARLGTAQPTDDQVAACIRDLRAIASTPSATIDQYVTRVSASSDPELASLIKRIRLADAKAETSSAEMQTRTISALHLPQDIDGATVVQSLYGWFVDTIQDKWRRREEGWVSRRSLDTQYHAILDQLKRSRRRESAERRVPVHADQRRVARNQGFVSRLVEIDLPDDEIDRAINYYLRHSTEKWRLSLLGEYTLDDWEDFYAELETRWEDIRLRIRRIAAQEAWPPNVHGRQLLEETTYAEFLGSLGGEPTTHFYFTRGGYHRLADADRVWWSPSYVPPKDDEE